MNQTDQGFELIVSDDLSSDDSLEIVKKICGNRATVYLNQSGQNLGLAGNWNRCVELSSGSWVTILHQDDLLTPVFFETHHKMLQQANRKPESVACPRPEHARDREREKVGGESGRK